MVAPMVKQQTENFSDIVKAQLLNEMFTCQIQN